MTLFSLAFLKATAERAVKSAAQGVIVLWAVGDGLLNAWSVDYKSAAGVALGMGLLSVVTSVASLPVGNSGPSLTTEKLDQQD